MNNKKEFISVIITNYNKEKYIKKTIQSIINQNYKNFEIIIFDDCSSDNSIKLIKKFKKIKLIRNTKKKYKTGPLNQINGILKSFNISKGKLICLLDADDKFEKDKLNQINNFFLNNSSKNFVVNLPQNNSNFNLKRINVDNSTWPSIFPTSCISFRRSFFSDFKKNIIFNKFPNLEIDARLIIYAFHSKKDMNIIHKNLTEYVDSDISISSNYLKFSINWWYKRKEAFDYLRYILKKQKIIFIKSLDYYLTNMIYFFLNLLKKN